MGSSSAWDLLLQCVGSQLPPVPASPEAEWLGAAVLMPVWDHPVGAAEVLGESLRSASAEWQVVPKHLVGVCFRNTMSLGAVGENRGCFMPFLGLHECPHSAFLCVQLCILSSSPSAVGLSWFQKQQFPHPTPCAALPGSPSTLCLVFGFPSRSPCRVCGFAGRVIPLASLELPGRGVRDTRGCWSLGTSTVDLGCARSTCCETATAVLPSLLLPGGIPWTQAPAGDRNPTAPLHGLGAGLNHLPGTRAVGAAHAGCKLHSQ